MKKLILILSVILTLSASAVYAKNARQELADNVIRLHILANSDNDADQQLKIKIRDRLLTDFKTQLSSSNNIEETRAFIYNNLTLIKHTAEDEARKNGYNYNVNVYLAKDFFPTKKYADVTLPAGQYEALRVEVGEAVGKNWWCVMFPPLCYADTTDCNVAAKSKKRLEQVLSGQQYSLITKNTPDVKVRLKIVEVWGNIKAGI